MEQQTMLTGSAKNSPKLGVKSSRRLEIPTSLIIDQMADAKKSDDVKGLNINTSKLVEDPELPSQLRTPPVTPKSKSVLVTSSSKMARKSVRSSLILQQAVSETDGLPPDSTRTHLTQKSHDQSVDEVIQPNGSPNRVADFLLKSRKSPMKGWHKRYFILENGFLTYGKSASDIERGHIHGTIDLGQAVVVYSQNGRRIDVDTDDIICHIKAKTSNQFDDWQQHIKRHHLYRSNEIKYGTKQAPRLIDLSPVSPVVVSPVLSPMKMMPTAAGVDMSIANMRTCMDRSGGQITTWLMDSHGAEAWNRELTVAQSKLFDLTRTLERIQNAPSPAVSVESAFELQDLTNLKPDKQSSKRHFVGRHKKDRSKDQPTAMPGASIPINVSSPALSLVSQDVDDAGSLLMDDFCKQATDVHEMLKGLCHAVTTERERLKQAVEHDSRSIVYNTQLLTQSLAETLRQNEDLRLRLERIHGESAVACSDDLPISASLNRMPSLNKHVSGISTLSAESPTEFFDAAEYLSSSSDYSEVEDEDDMEDTASETEQVTSPTQHSEVSSKLLRRRRSKLPVPETRSDLRLWSLLCKNIGKDLSKLSLPVSLNEPLNALQRLCEELEYSDLLDQCCEISDPAERMVLVATFAVSGYASTISRCAHKPFNPLLGETYECIRDDKGWKFFAEQVSHHPPISSCYCQSSNFIYWQDMQVKTKFWGKSMEVQPLGSIHMKLLKHDETYSWNKATSCIHNLLGGQRWVEHHGEVTIQNHTLNIVCKLSFVKSSYQSENRNDVQGTIYGSDGQVIQQLYGRWNEGIYLGTASTSKCIWRPCVMLLDADTYYGFTRFAVELNEIDAEQIHLYAPTDTRFRPDQRLLEEGKLAEAENEKQRLEQLQRDRLKAYNDGRALYSPTWFLKNTVDGADTYTYSHKYWEMRVNPGFSSLALPKLW